MANKSGNKWVVLSIVCVAIAIGGTIYLLSRKSKKLSALGAALKSSDQSKLLQPGMTNDQDVKYLQQYLNRITSIATAKGQQVALMLTVNGNFDQATLSALKMYLNKQSITVGEIAAGVNGLLAGENNSAIAGGEVADSLASIGSFG